MKVAERVNASEINRQLSSKAFRWRSEMATRQNMIICMFDPAGPQISAFYIHEWLHESLHIQQKVNMIQIDSIKGQVYIKLTDREYVVHYT